LLIYRYCTRIIINSANTGPRILLIKKEQNLQCLKSRSRSKNVLIRIFFHLSHKIVMSVFFQASFLIPPEVVPGRMTLLVTLFLVLINIFTNITSNSPNVESLTSISAWVIACILFVFGALLGYAGLLIKKKILVKVIFCWFNQESLLKGKDQYYLQVLSSSYQLLFMLLLYISFFIKQSYFMRWSTIKKGSLVYSYTML